MPSRAFSPLVLLLMAAPLLAADSKGPRIQSQLANDKVAAAWKTCERLMEKGALQHDDEIEACARADLGRLELLHPDGLSLEMLNGHWTRWGGTEASYQTRCQAAQIRLARASGDLDMLAAIWGAFSDTPAGQASSDLIYQHYVDENSSAAMAEFVKRFPDAPQVERAREQTDDLLWAETEAQETAAAWADFMKKHPTHPRLAEAVRWHQTLAFREAEDDGTAQTWAQFLSDFPDHPRYEEAENNRINAMFSEAEDKGPDVMLAVADAWPDHPLSELSRAKAYAMLMEVQLLSRGYHDPAWKPRPGHTDERLTVPVGIDGLNVIFPPDQPVADVSLIYFEQTGPSALGGLYAERLASQGFPSDRVENITTLNWLPPQGNKVVGRSKKPLCAPDNLDSWFSVVTQLQGQELVFPFQVGVICSQARP